MDLLYSVANTIVQHRLVEPGERVILAVSGGPDSTALADLMVRFREKYYPMELTLACLDHGLWPEAREDIKRIESLAQRYGLNFVSEQIRLLDDGKTAIEERGREIRYRFLERVALKSDARKVAAGHHADDQAETLLFRLLEGTGIYGLSAMPLSRPIHENSPVILIRPLLKVRKAALRAYLKWRGLGWWDDPSNYYPNYTRNRTRNKIIPFLESEGYRDVVAALCRTAERCREVLSYLTEKAEEVYRDLIGNWCPARPDVQNMFIALEGRKVCAINSEKWDRVPAALLPIIMRKIFSDIGAKGKFLRERHYRLLRKAGGVKLPDGVLLWRTRDRTFFIREERGSLFLPATIPIPGRVVISPTAEIHADLISREDWEKRCGPSLLEVGLHCPSLTALTIRSCKPGDILWPFRAPGRRKVSRIAIDIKIPRPLRESLLAVTDERGEILWLPGICIAHTSRVVPESTEVLWLRLIKNSE